MKRPATLEDPGICPDEVDAEITAADAAGEAAERAWR
jgi:hypothetical protein